MIQYYLIDIPEITNALDKESQSVKSYSAPSRGGTRKPLIS